jgi:hypothetical protein
MDCGQADGLLGERAAPAPKLREVQHARQRLHQPVTALLNEFRKLRKRGEVHLVGVAAEMAQRGAKRSFPPRPRVKAFHDFLCALYEISWARSSSLTSGLSSPNRIRG